MENNRIAAVNATQIYLDLSEDELELMHRKYVI